MARKPLSAALIAVLALGIGTGGARPAAASAQEKEQSFHVVGRGIEDTENKLVLQLGCHDESCASMQFLLFSVQSDPAWIGPVFSAKDHEQAIALVHERFAPPSSGWELPKNLEQQTVFKKVKNGAWQKLEADMGGPVMATVVAVIVGAWVGFIGIVAPGAFPVALLFYLGAGPGPEIGMSVADAPFVGFRNKVFKSYFFDKASDVTLKVAEDRSKMNWSVRPKKIHPTSFKLILNALSGSDDAGLEAFYPMSKCRIKNVTVSSEDQYSYDSFLSALGIRRQQSTDRASGQRRSTAVLTLRVPCRENGTELPEWDDSCVSHRSFEIDPDRLFIESLRANALYDPASEDAFEARVTVSRRRSKYRARLELVSGNQRLEFEARSKKPVLLLQKLAKEVRGCKATVF